MKEKYIKTKQKREIYTRCTNCIVYRVYTTNRHGYTVFTLCSVQGVQQNDVDVHTNYVTNTHTRRHIFRGYFAGTELVTFLGAREFL